MSAQSRNIAISSTDGHTGNLIAELLLTDDNFRQKFDTLTCITLHPEHERVKSLEKQGALIVPHIPGKVDILVNILQKANIDTICVIPPAVDDKVQLTEEMILAAKEADVSNSLLISSAGAEFADPKKQPHLKEFLDIEVMFMNAKGDKSTKLGSSPAVIRAGFYAEAVLLYNQQAKTTGKLPIPLGDGHKFAPVALGDIANLAAHVLIGQGPHGFDDRHRGQIMIATGPMLMSGVDLANAARNAIGVRLDYEDISEKEAKHLLDNHPEPISESEKQVLLEYYSMVREGKTNYVSTTAYKFVTGEQPTEPSEFFSLYEGEFKPKRRKVERKN